KPGAKSFAAEAGGKELWNVLSLPPVADALAEQPPSRCMGCEVPQLAQPMGPAVLVDRDVLHIAEPEVRLAQAIGDRLRRKSGPALAPVKAPFLGRGDQHAIA